MNDGDYADVDVWVDELVELTPAGYAELLRCISETTGRKWNYAEVGAAPYWLAFDVRDVVVVRRVYDLSK